MRDCLNIFGSMKKYGEETEFKWSILQWTFACNKGLKQCKLFLEEKSQIVFQ